MMLTDTGDRNVAECCQHQHECPWNVSVSEAAITAGRQSGICFRHLCYFVRLLVTELSFVNICTVLILSSNQSRAYLLIRCVCGVCVGCVGGWCVWGVWVWCVWGVWGLGVGGGVGGGGGG